MVKTPKGERDRPFWKQVTIRDEHMGQMRQILNAIGEVRQGIIRHIDCKTSNVTTYYVRLKAQEIMLIKLSIPNVIIKRTK